MTVAELLRTLEQMPGDAILQMSVEGDCVREPIEGVVIDGNEVVLAARLADITQ